MQTWTSFGRFSAAALATALFFGQHSAQACEGCKQAVGMGDGAGGSRVVNLIGVGYAISIGFMLLMVASLLTGLGYMMYRNCQAIATRQSAMLAEEEPGGFGGAMPAAGNA